MPRYVITEYKRKRAKEREIIDVEVVEDESSEKCDHGHVNQGENSDSRLPVPLPKLSELQHDSNERLEYPRFSEEWWDAQPPAVQLTRCRADVVNGAGRCKNRSVKGARVCNNHGAKAPAVKAAARNRLEMAADHLVQRLLQMPDSDEIKAETRLRAIDSALDRIGLKAPTEVVLSPGGQQPTGFDEVFEGIYSGPRDRSSEGLVTGQTPTFNGSLGIDSDVDGVIGPADPSTDFDYRDIQGPVAQQQDQNHPTQHRSTADHGTNHAAGTPHDPYDPLSEPPAHADHAGRPSSRGCRQNGLDEHLAPREYGRPARPGAQVSGYEAMRIAREAQELSRRLAGL
ncbi:hypothetical protein [Mycolicibacterium fortuitum]|uniref:hypothetical protein n=1 Tax=Mycolicibacterium fortuitum TaxID=1766 RepID=UPI001A95C2E1|nr:hypothetical protein [Mycolicibacterium fortuitum]